ncbi:hypothetical protein M3G15_09580 [Paenibacillus sp. p3-SID1389]|uniref:hypothetical protein n=1 Tax=Paenibacillus sp. p3-SID1389 TaxID=2916364 RepID=UPI0021A78194|nr:hypothetical protein [Paenibacillus sp. p3-SID1389]MCT2195390.1 hypothetical protein [Paenibacillus sp. p3-SID1389]
MDNIKEGGISLKNKFENLLSSMGIVVVLGVSIIFLSIIRINYDTVPPTLILGIAIASLGFITLDFLSIIFNVHVFVKQLIQLISISAIICLPYFPYFNNIKEENLARGVDSLSLIVFGMTVGIIGIKGHFEALDEVKERQAFLNELKKDVIDLKEEIVVLKPEVEKLNSTHSDDC